MVMVINTSAKVTAEYAAKVVVILRNFYEPPYLSNTLGSEDVLWNINIKKVI